MNPSWQNSSAKGTARTPSRPASVSRSRSIASITWATARAAAARDREIATLWHDINNERVARARASAHRLAAKTTLRTSVPGAAHTLWALTVPELYVLHVKEAGRSPEAYQNWLADVLIAVLLAH